MEIWIEFNQGKWRITPDPAKIHRGGPILWRFRGDSLNARRVRWTIYFDNDHPFSIGADLGAIRAARLAIATETFRLPDGQHVGTSPTVTADEPGHYKYGVRSQDMDEERELGDEDPVLIVL